MRRLAVMVHPVVEILRCRLQSEVPSLRLCSRAVFEAQTQEQPDRHKHFPAAAKRFPAAANCFPAAAKRFPAAAKRFLVAAMAIDSPDSELRLLALEVGP